MKTAIKDWLKVLLLLMDEAAVIVLVLLVLWLLDVEIPLPILIPGAIALGALIFVIHKAVIPTFHKEKVTGEEAMIGLSGKVVEPLKPSGIIRVGSESWKARTVGDNVAAGEEVEILGRDGLTLKVKLKEK